MLAVFVEALDRSCRKIDRIDPSARVARGCGSRHEAPGTLVPFEAAAVADVAAAVRSDRRAIGAAPGDRDHALLTVRADSREPSACKLAHQHRAVGERDRSLRKA